jgi:hypothetical protein
MISTWWAPVLSEIVLALPDVGRMAPLASGGVVSAVRVHSQPDFRWYGPPKVRHCANRTGTNAFGHDPNSNSKDGMGIWVLCRISKARAERAPARVTGFSEFCVFSFRTSMLIPRVGVVVNVVCQACVALVTRRE